MNTKNHLLVSVAGSFAFLLSSWAVAAEDAAKTNPLPAYEPTRIAMVDVNFLFKQHTAFKEEMDKLKKEADAMDKNMKEQDALIRQQTAQLQQMKTDTPEYADLEGRVAKAKTDWTLKIQNQRRVFMQREANSYRLTFQEISKEIASYAGEHHIDMVMRFSNEPVDSNNPQSILTDINKPVLYFDPKLDITPYILKNLLDKHKPAPQEEKKEEKQPPSEQKKEEKQPPKEDQPPTPGEISGGDISPLFDFRPAVDQG